MTTRRRGSPEAIFLARRIAHRNRLEVTGMSREVVDQRSGDFWADAEALIAEQRRAR